MAGGDYKAPLPADDYRDDEGAGWKGERAGGSVDERVEAPQPGSPMLVEAGGNNNRNKKVSPQKNLNSCSMCVRYILIIGNCIFFLLACTVIGLGIHLVVDKVNLVSQVFAIPLIAPASYLILASGCIVFIISFIGCFGALFESKLALFVYSTALGLVLILSTVGIILAIVFETKVNDQIMNTMKNTLQKEYGVNLDNEWNRVVTEAWDSAQHKWYCCGVVNDGYGAYKSSEWQKAQAASAELLKPLVPLSCCVRDQYNRYISEQKCQTWADGPPTKPSNQVNTALFYTVIHYRVGVPQHCQQSIIRCDSCPSVSATPYRVTGCYEAGKKVLNEIAGYLIGIGVALAVLVIGGLVLAIILARSV